MSKNWTDKLPDLMEGLQEAPPEGLWDAVLGEMQPKRRVVPVFWWIGAGVAAAAAAVILAVFLWKPATQSPVVPGVVPSAVENMVAEASEPIIEDIGEPQPVQEARPQSAKHNEPVAEPADEPVEEPVQEDPVPVSEPVEEKVEEPAAEPVVEPTAEPAAQPARKKYRKEIGLTFRTGNYLADAGTIVTNGYGVPQNPGMPGIATKSSGGAFSAPMLSRNRQSTTYENHRQGARLFLGLNYGFASRWSVETGLSYKVLQSDYSTESGLTETFTNRNMTYLGVPLYVQYNAIEQGRLLLYLNAGPMLEKCVSVNIDTNTYISGALSSKESEDVSCDDTRVSLNAGAGAQLRVFRHGALFVQPGLTWHIPGSSGVTNYYTVCPLSWDLSFGYRIVF